MEPDPKNNDPAEQLKRLSNLHADGILTDDEFKALKAKLIAGISAGADTDGSQSNHSLDNHVRSAKQSENISSPFFRSIGKLSDDRKVLAVVIGFIVIIGAVIIASMFFNGDNGSSESSQAENESPLSAPSLPTNKLSDHMATNVPNVSVSVPITVFKTSPTSETVHVGQRGTILDDWVTRQVPGTIIVVAKDDVVIQNIILNRGNCSQHEPASGLSGLFVGQHNPYVTFPKSLAFGATLKMDIECDTLIEAAIETNKGNSAVRWSE